MKTIAHLTDIHLDSVPGLLEAAGRAAIASAPADAVVIITGDIATSGTLSTFLPDFVDGLGRRRVFFLLGNHDAWFGSIAGSRRDAAAFSVEHPDVVYVPAAGIVELTPRTALCGVDGWYDGRAGALASSMVLNDWKLVDELKGLHAQRRREVLEHLARQDAAGARQVLTTALARYDHVVFGTHVPPFPDSAVSPGGGRCDNEALPWYCNLTMGHMLADVAAEHPDRRITVLCGHSHGAAAVDVAPNLRVCTGAAAYGRPSLAGLIEVD